MRRVALVLSGLAACLCGTAAKAAPADAAPVVQRIWGKLLSHCGQSYFYAGSPFDSSGMLSNVQVNHQKTIEYRGVRFFTVPIRVTDADQANGISYRGRISMVAHLYREGDGAWRDGPDIQPRNTDDILGRAIGSANADMFDMGSNGAMALSLVRFKGTWAVARSSVDSTSTIGFGSNYFDVEKLLAARINSYSCAAGGVVVPPPTAAEVAAKTAAERKAKQDVADTNEKLARIARVKAEGLAKVAWTGSAMDFRWALQKSIFDRAPALNVDPRLYAHDFDAVIEFVESCKGLTEEDWLEGHGRGRNRDMSQLVKRCDGMAGGAGRFGYNVSPSGRERPLDVDIRIATLDPATKNYAVRDQFTVDVYYEPLDKDPPTSYEDAFGKYIIISAKIPFERATAAAATDAPK